MRMTARAEVQMLADFILSNRDEILRRSRALLSTRKVSTPTEPELVQGLPLFLDQLAASISAKQDDVGGMRGKMGASATLHGAELLKLGLTVGQVVHDYGSICQAVTDLADERDVAISAEEFHTFNQCLDDAIAQAVTEYQRQRDRATGGPGMEYLGFLAHEMRNLLTTTMLTYEALSKGNVGMHGSTGALHARSLRRMRVLIDRSLAEVRLAAETQRAERVSVAELLEEIEIVATIEAKDRDIRLTVELCPHDVMVDADSQVLASVVANLVQNAFKFTKAHGHITLRARADGDRVLVDVEDECGGLPPGKVADLFRPYEQRGADQTGLGLGLAISLKGVEANGGQIHVRDIAGRGCVFTVDMPKSPIPSSPA
jgi:signal transduction histidine kinase